MAYLPPPHWNHGDRVSAEQLNILGGNLIDIYNRTAGVNLQFGSLSISGEHSYLFVHRYRWLHFLNQGTIVPLFETTPAAFDAVDISSPANTWSAAFDLDSVVGLSYGAFYVVNGVSWAVEDATA